MKIMIWTDQDLDGAGSAMLIKHIYQEKATKIDIRQVYRNSFSGEWKGWCKDIDKYDKVFILDSFVPDDIVDSVDTKQVIIIDHHISQIEANRTYQNAKSFIVECTSTVKLIQTIYKPKLTDELKLLFTYIDDYDSYTLKYKKQSLELNIIFGISQYPRVETFIENWSDGIREYTTHEKNAIKLWVKQFKDQVSRLDIFHGTFNGYNVVSCFSEVAPNEISTLILKRYNADVSIVINLETKRVCFRKSQHCNAKLHKWAEILCEGGGHEYAAGGILTDKLMKLASQFSQHVKSD